MTGQPQVLYTEAVEGFFIRGVGKRLSPGAKARLQEAGLDLTQKLKPTYPLETYRRCMHIAREDLFPSLSVAQGFRKIGEETVLGYGETVMGRALLGLARLMGPIRTITRMDATARGVNNFTRTRISNVQEKGLDYWFNELSVTPDFTSGLLLATVRVCGGVDVQVDYLADAEPHTFRVRWS